MPSGETLSNSCYNPQGGSSLPRAESPKRESADNKATESECNYSSPAAAAATGEREGGRREGCAPRTAAAVRYAVLPCRKRRDEKALSRISQHIRRGSGVKKICLHNVVQRREKEER